VFFGFFFGLVFFVGVFNANPGYHKAQNMMPISNIKKITGIGRKLLHKVITKLKNSSFPSLLCLKVTFSRMNLF
jgi:hypothetical protein